MLTVLFFYFFIITITISIIAVFFRFFSKKVTKVIARKVEVVGYCLLFVSIMTTGIIESISFDEMVKGDPLQVTNKLDNIFLYLQIISGEDGINGESIINSYNEDYIGQRWRGQVKTVKICNLFIIFMSTIFISIGRLYDVRSIN